jgi:hypothetical protein
VGLNPRCVMMLALLGAVALGGIIGFLTADIVVWIYDKPGSTASYAIGVLGKQHPWIPPVFLIGGIAIVWVLYAHFFGLAIIGFDGAADRGIQ